MPLDLLLLLNADMRVLGFNGSQSSFLISPHALLLLCFISTLLGSGCQFVLLTSVIFSNKRSPSLIVSRLKRSFSYRSEHDWNCSDSSEVKPGMFLVLHPLGINFLEIRFTIFSNVSYWSLVAVR